jgi:hypothetical protein
MRWHKIASQILLILSIFNFVLAAPVAVREINEVRVDAVDVAKVWMAASEKRMDPGDRSSTNAGYLTDESVIEWNTISSDSTASGSESDSDTATSRPPSSPGSHPGSTDDSPSHPPADNPSPSPPSHPGPAGNPPPSPPSPPGPPVGNPPPLPPGPAGNPPPSHSVPTMDVHSPPSAEPQHPGAPEFENFFGKLMKGKFKRRISGYGPVNVVQRVLQDVARYRWSSRVRLYPFIPPSSTDAQTTRVTNILIFLCSIVRDLEIIE